MHRIEAIERLARLKESGAISEAEFEAQKQRLLAQPEARPFASRRTAGIIAAGLALLGVGAVALLWQSPQDPPPARTATAPATTSVTTPPAAAQLNSAAQPAKPPATEESAAPTPPEDRQPPEAPAGLTRAQLIGRWANLEAGCSGDDAAVTLRSDGSYESLGGGRWRLEGSTLHMTNWGGAPARIALRPNGDLHLTWSYGAETWRRCPD